jgi:hypothetical protein
MGIARSSHPGIERTPVQAVLGWTLAAFIAVVAVLGPPLTGQAVPALVEMRHDVLMIDREFEWPSMRSHTASLRTDALVCDDLKHGSRCIGLRTPIRGGVS